MIAAEPTIALPGESLSELVWRLHPEMHRLLEGRAETDWAEADLASAHIGFTTERFVALPGLLSAADTALLGPYYRRLIAVGLMGWATDPVRLVINDDPVGRALLRQIRPTVQTIVGRPIRESYTFAAEYSGGVALRMHTDRIQCEYTISLFLDYTPLVPGARSPWSLDILSPGRPQPLRFHQARGEGILFKGRELVHGRMALPADERCLVLMLHYVDADFPEEQLDRC